jgi:hypothetical protein
LDEFEEIDFDKKQKRKNKNKQKTQYKQEKVEKKEEKGLRVCLSDKWTLVAFPRNLDAVIDILR